MSPMSPQPSWSSRTSRASSRRCRSGCAARASPSPWPPTASRRSSASTSCAPTSCCSTSCCPGCRASTSAGSCARRARCRSSWSRPRAPRSTPSSASRSAPMTTSPSRTGCASWWPACAPCCAARPVTKPASSAPLRSASATSRSTPRSTRSCCAASRWRCPLKEFELLHVLLANAGRVLPRDTLIDRVWGSDYVGDTKTLDVHVKRLRSEDRTRPGQPDPHRHHPRAWATSSSA